MSASKALGRQQKHVLRQQRLKQNEARATAAKDVVVQPLAPQSVQTHPRQPTLVFKTFVEFLHQTPPLCERTDSDGAYRLADYCRSSEAIMMRVARALFISDSNVQRSVMTPEQRFALQNLRSVWRAHLTANAHTLWAPPPASGGETMRFSLALQLWRLIAYANIILQLCHATGKLFHFCPAEHEYLLRNRLVVDTGCVMQYPMRTLMLALECFVERLDQIDRFEPTYAQYATALEHRLSELITMCGTSNEFNAHEWSRPSEGVAPSGIPDLLSATAAFQQYTLVYALTIAWYAERYDAVHTLRVLRADIATEPYERIVSRVPLHVVLHSDWVPSQRSVNRALDFFCEYAHNLLDDSYQRALRMFLLEFELRPCDLDLYRMLRYNNTAFARSALEFEFQNANAIGRTYVNRIHYNRPPYAYLKELVQWTTGNERTTRSAPLDRDGMIRQLAVVYVIDQFVMSRYAVRWRERYLLFHRDTSFHTALQSARTFMHPIIVQQFNRFSVLVPHRRAPEHDVRRVLYWRAQVRARQAGRTLTIAPPPDVPDDAEYARHARAYDAATVLDAFAIWALWFVVLNNAALDSTTDMKDFLVSLFGWQ